MAGENGGRQGAATERIRSDTRGSWNAAERRFPAASRRSVIFRQPLMFRLAVSESFRPRLVVRAGRVEGGSGIDGWPFFVCHPEEGVVTEGEEPAGKGEGREGGNGEGKVENGCAVGEGIDAGEEAAEEEESRENEESQGEEACDDGGAEAPGGFAPEAVCGGWAWTVLRGRFRAGHGEGGGRVGSGSLVR